MKCDFIYNITKIKKLNLNTLFRFPNWSQGLWSNLQVYGNVAYYTDVDDNQQNESLELVTVDSHYQVAEANNSFNYDITQENIKYMTRSFTQQQQRQITKFKWRCIMSVYTDEKQHQGHKTGAKFLTYGGRIMKKNVLNGNDKK